MKDKRRLVRSCQLAEMVQVLLASTACWRLPSRDDRRLLILVLRQAGRFVWDLLSSGGGSSWWWESWRCLLLSAPCDPSASPLEAPNTRLMLHKQSRQRSGKIARCLTVVSLTLPGDARTSSDSCYYIMMNSVGNKRKRCCSNTPWEQNGKSPMWVEPFRSYLHLSR